ncbi:FAD/NAD(P)-binding domain-containing protein [Eremomyces bilateralis CBS 781.70]|uniref:L-ornithine N(5)-monooxygenase [NAD(P)H] n=1 Tax=Eremomyces bilateralis CBS 781.70 TaxID=1392243 RepID=A0A6G1G598_9PEZI|nr:FAD/NAD(P)-binding domain-containing protein [Eremomyces bilateralis CBS 781.70]KAF1813070.1 FAD/NAD(P)-binding domain-containing protein [Eremomyces bilateralis CBS 781.70]
MSPSAISVPIVGEESLERSLNNGSYSLNGHSVNGAVQPPLKEAVSGTQKPQSFLESPNDDDLLDFICVGFGPASLSIAVALHDSLEEQFKVEGRSASPKVLFLEKQNQFRWHGGMLIEGAKMQISFLKDMATFRNPKSDFTFLNYLHQNDRLVQFANLSTFLPLRIEYDDYMRWCAQKFDHVVRYGQEVIQIAPEKQVSVANGPVQVFEVASRDLRTGTQTVHRARNVVIAVGGQPQIPAPFPNSNPRVIHSSQYAYMPAKLRQKGGTYNHIAVVGSGQSAAEIFEDIQSQHLDSKVSMIMRDSALRPSDDSPFVNEVFDPESTHAFFSQPPCGRAQTLARNHNTNYSVVRPGLIDRIYESLYAQRLVYGSDTNSWRTRILPSRQVLSAEPIHNGIKLRIAPEKSGSNGVDVQHADGTELDVDLLILATGYSRTLHRDLLSPCKSLLSSPDKESGKFPVRRNYSVAFEPGTVAEESSGIWLQGCCEQSHGLSDSLLSVLAVRGGEMVESMFGKKMEKLG